MSPDNSKNLARDLESDGFIARFGGVFEHSPWIAEAALAENPGLLHADVGTWSCCAPIRTLPESWRWRVN
jgi:2-oxo-4-hydroxy-4-carboxy--5-ureidoimidazoline (OHCU) decarboxylase